MEKSDSESHAIKELKMIKAQSKSIFDLRR
jgi:hypothetical protein